MTDLAEAFASFRSSAWRLEARDHYEVPEYDAELEAFLAGRPRPPRTDGWQATVEGAIQRGAEIGRVRLVGRPITDYTRFEFELYRENVGWGEDVRIVDRAWLDESWAVAPDVWLFDDELAFRQDYTDDGRYLGASPVDPAPVVDIRRVVIATSVPASEYHLTDPPPPPPWRDPASASPLPNVAHR